MSKRVFPSSGSPEKGSWAPISRLVRPRQRLWPACGAEGSLSDGALPVELVSPVESVRVELLGRGVAVEGGSLHTRSLPGVWSCWKDWFLRRRL